MESIDAKGHTAKIYDFDEETVFIPFNEHELRRLMISFERHIDILQRSGDYPEISKDHDTLFNLQTGYGTLLTLKSKK